MTGTGVLNQKHASNTQMVVWKDSGNTIVSFFDSKLTHTVSYQEDTTV